MPHFSFAVDHWTDEILKEVPALADEVEKYEALPGVFFANTSTERAQSIAKLEGVRSYRPSSEGARRIVWSINEQVMIAVAHRREIGANGIANAAEVFRESGEPKQPVLRVSDGAVHWGFDDDVVLPTRFCFVAAINISLESEKRFDYHPDDPVCLAATDAARVLPVVFAAGNVKPGSKDRSMFGWSVSPAVISVGATTPDGSAVAAYSRIGAEEAGIAGPTVVASGEDESGEHGTSFAAPVVATQLAYLSSALLLLRSVALGLVDPENAEGVPLAGRAFVDIAASHRGAGHGALVHDFRERRRKLPSLPIGGVDSTALASLVAATGGRASPLLQMPTTDMLRRLLIASAIAVPGASPSLVGAGFVCDATTERFLVHLTAVGLAEHLGLDVTAPDGGWQETRLFDPLILSAFLSGARDSMIGWASDILRFENGDPPFEFVEERHK